MIDGIQFIHYKNAIYTGNLFEGRRQGSGILYLDNSSIIIGSFRSDQLIKNAIIWTSYDTYFIGQFNKGKIDGNFVLRSPSYVIYSCMKNNVISSDILVINHRQHLAKLWTIENQEVHCVKQIQINPYETQLNIIKILAPYTELIPTAHEFIKKEFAQSMDIKLLKKKQITVEVKGLEGSKLTLKISNEEIVSFGVTQQGVLEGLGLLRQENFYYEGEFKNNQLTGEGIKSDLDSSKIIYGNFEKGDIRNMLSINDKQQAAIKLLQRLKKKIHIHSLSFINTYINERPIMLIKDISTFVREHQEIYQVPKFRGQPQSAMKERQVLISSKGKMDKLSNELEQYNVINKALKSRR